jgi:Bacterial Ig-like domain (group 3)
MNCFVTRFCRVIGGPKHLRRPLGGLRSLSCFICCLCALTFTGCGGVASTTPPATATPTTTTLTATPTVVLLGAAVTLSASVTYPPAETASGIVNFSDGAVALGGVSLDAKGIASLRVTALAVGAHAITARFAGNGTTATSISRPVVVTVLAPAMTGATASILGD